MCVLLKNRFQEIRDVARDTLIKIIETLGSRYLQYLLKEMQTVLVKGYQVNGFYCCGGYLQLLFKLRFLLLLYP